MFVSGGIRSNVIAKIAVVVPIERRSRKKKKQPEDPFCHWKSRNYIIGLLDRDVLNFADQIKVILHTINLIWKNKNTELLLDWLNF